MPHVHTSLTTKEYVAPASRFVVMQNVVDRLVIGVVHSATFRKESPFFKEEISHDKNPHPLERGEEHGPPTLAVHETLAVVLLLIEVSTSAMTETGVEDWTLVIVLEGRLTAEESGEVDDVHTLCTVKATFEE